MKPLSARSFLLLLILSLSASLILAQGDAQPSARGQSSVALAKAEGLPVEAERDQKVREFMVRGTRHYENAEFEEALACYENARRLAPQQPSLKAVIDYAQANLRSQQALLASLSEADAKPSKAAKTAYRAACDLFEEGDYDQAYNEFYKVWLLAGDYRSTRKYLKEIVKARGASPASSPQTEPSPAAEARNDGGTQMPGKATDAATDKVRVERARVFLKQGQYDLAAALFEEVLENDPQSAQARRGLERAQTAIGDEERARQDETRRQEIEREMETLLTRASAALDAGQYGSAMEAYRQVASVDPGNRQARRGIDKASKAQAAEEKAKQEAIERERRAAAEAERRAAEEKIADAVARAEDRAKAGEFDAAIEAYNVALAADPENREAARGLKKAETAQQRLEEEKVKAKSQAEEARLRAEAEREQR
ncbi:MAG TPA: tetratricopeptide repeat protein, partial [Sumerlaeia bacterium]|nr:tetratricopeptide repeat protein [Sumerlaeia bacterium]